MKLKIIIFIILINFSFIMTIYSQVTGESSELINFSKFYKMTSEQEQLTTGPTALEEVINPDQYIVGPGDKLKVNIGGESNTSFELQITPEGKILIPTVKDIDLNNLTLTESKKKIIEAVSERYINSEVAVHLTVLRKFRVTVSGHVENPGSFIVTAADRVSDAIRQANIPLVPEERITDPSIETYSGKRAPIPVKVKKIPSKRHITLTRKSGEILPVDLLGYEITGRKDKNPYLLEGDVIYVPVYTKNLPTVEIRGAVHAPEIYELMEGDRVMDIVKIAHGFNYHADLSNIEISRFNPDNKTTTAFRADLSQAASDNVDLENNVLLEADDRIYVRYIPEYHHKHTVEIKGEIMSPGHYTIEFGKTTLSEIVKAAGGFTENASLKEAFVIRRTYEEIVDPEYVRLLQMRVEEMTDLEKAYFRIKSRERKGLIAVDFVKLFIDSDSRQDVILQNNDYIEIPVKAEVVIISGQVIKPGIVSYEKGKELNYYLQKAGGYGWNADNDKVRIIRAETGVWIKPKRNTAINVGDTILVPERKEIDFWAITRDFLQISAQFATLIFLIQTSAK